MAKPITTYHWIVDGHNLVLNVPELSRLYDRESKKAAREAAENRLADLAERCAGGVRLVFDGQTFAEKQPGNRVAGPLEVTFVDPPAEADDWIVQLARQAAESGNPVAIATSDRGLLARLPGGVPIHRMGVEAFWRETGRIVRQEPVGGRAEKPEPGVETGAEMAALETSMRRSDRDEGSRWKPSPAITTPEPRVEPDAADEIAPPSPPRPPDRAAPPPPPRRAEPSWQEKLQMKKEIGRRRQDRRLRRTRGR